MKDPPASHKAGLRRDKKDTMAKKSAPKTKKIVSKSKPVARAKVVSHPTHAKKLGYTHSSVLSDTALMLLALFFALVGLFAVLVFRQQSDDIDAWAQRRERRDAEMFAVRPRVSPAPKIGSLKR